MKLLFRLQYYRLTYCKKIFLIPTVPILNQGKKMFVEIDKLTHCINYELLIQQIQRAS